MRRMLAVVLGLVALAAGGAPARAQVDLGAAVLTAEETGPGFSTFQTGPVEQATALGIPSYLAVFVRAPSLLNFSFEAVAVALVDDNAAQALGQDGLAATIDAQLGALAAFGVTATPAPAPEIGRETVRYTVAGTFSGIAVSGDVIIWRQGPLIAGVAAIGTRTPASERHAIHQFEKLSALGITE